MFIPNLEGPLKILSDNGTEFKNKLFEQIFKELWSGVQIVYSHHIVQPQMAE